MDTTSRHELWFFKPEFAQRFTDEQALMSKLSDLIYGTSSLTPVCPCPDCHGL